MLASGSPGSSVTPSPCCPPLASWANVVITYLLSDFLGLWQAMQFWTRIGATSFRKLTGAPASGVAGVASGVLGSSARVVAAGDRVSVVNRPIRRTRDIARILKRENRKTILPPS